MLIIIVFNTIIYSEEFFFGKGFRPMIWSKMHNLRMQRDFPHNICAKNESYGGCSNNTFDSETQVVSKVHNSRNKDPIVKLGSFGRKLLELYIFFIPMTIHYHFCKGNEQLPKAKYHLLHTCNLGSQVFPWSILSWIMHKNSSFDHTHYVLQVWYKFLHIF
jgi:hypothetical protein